MPERWPQACRVKITFELLPTICFVSTTTNSMKRLINWIPLNTHVRFEQNPTLPLTNILGGEKYYWITYKENNTV